MFRKSDPRETRRGNLRYLVDKYGQAVVAKKAGKPDRQIADIVAGRKACGEKLALSIEENWRRSTGESVDLSYIGMVEDYEANEENRKSAGNVVQLKRPDDEVLIDQFDTGGAMGHGLELRDQPGIIHSWRVNPEWLERNVRSHSSVKNLCIVTGFGDSMQPVFNPGVPLLVAIGVQTVEFHSIYSFRLGNDGYVTRLQRIPTEDGLVLRARAEHDVYEPFDISEKMDFEVLGRVLKVWRSYDF